MSAGLRTRSRIRKPSRTFDGRLPGMTHGAYSPEDAYYDIYSPGFEWAKLGACTWRRHNKPARRAAWLVSCEPLPGIFHQVEAITDDFGNLVVPHAYHEQLQAWGLPS